MTGDGIKEVKLPKRKIPAKSKKIPAKKVAIDIKIAAIAPVGPEIW